LSVSGRIHHIQALRGIAASAVVLDHALSPLVKSGVLPTYFDDVRYNIGNLGVVVFFIISGFIMIRTNRAFFGSPGASKKFLLRRLTRIIPIYWAGTALAFLFVGMVEKEWRPLELGLSLAFVPYFDAVHGVMKPILNVGWTLNYEMFFYAVFAIAMLLPLKIGVFFVASVFTVLVSAHLLLAGPGNPTHSAALFLSDRIVLLFVVGVFIGLFVKMPQIAFRFPLACVVFAAMCGAYVFMRSLDDAAFPADLWMWVPAAMVVMLCSGNSGEESAFARWAERFGDASYSTYIFNIFIVAALAKVMPVTSWATGLMFVLTSLVASNLIGLSINSWVERPALSRLRYLSFRHPKGAAG
jgi:exopolysaccharide production protein ExoZ